MFLWNSPYPSLHKVTTSNFKSQYKCKPFRKASCIVSNSLPILINLLGNLLCSGFPTRMRAAWWLGPCLSRSPTYLMLLAKHLAHICCLRYFYGWMNKWLPDRLAVWMDDVLEHYPSCPNMKNKQQQKPTCQLRYRYHSWKSACKFEFHFKNMISHYNFMNYLSFALSDFGKHPFLTIEKSLSSDYWLRINCIWESGGLKSVHRSHLVCPPPNLQPGILSMISEPFSFVT